ncbi:MAG: hypothetical protein JWN66_1568, partial [Sphingomonas bacterium]|nr:hypothetical protein [Sphingomonas bacterium]
METVQYPELVFGLAGAIGIDIEEIDRTVADALKAVGYKAVPVRVTAEIADETTNVPRPEVSDFGSDVSYKMAHASAICRKYKSADTIMRFAIRAIRRHRASVAINPGLADEDFVAEEQVAYKTAYIIR